MSVCYVLSSYPVLSQTFVHAELVALRARGVEVGVVAHTAGDPDLRFGDGPDGVPFPVLHEGLDEDGLVEVLRRFDHLHGHFADFGMRTLAPLADAADRPFSFTAHAYDLFRRDAAVTRTEWSRLPERLTKVVTISTFHRSFLRARGVPDERIAVIPNAARLAHLLESAPPPPTKLRKVLAVGRPIPKKGFAHLVNAWAKVANRCPELELEIIGGEGMVEDPPERLSLRPMVPYAEVLQAMREADLVAAPSVVAENGDMDGIPTVLAEAGALRRPVLASRLTGIPDLVVHGVNGFLVPAGDEDALASALLRLTRRPDELTLLGSGGPTLAAAHDANVVAAALATEVFGS